MKVHNPLEYDLGGKRLCIAQVGTRIRIEQPVEMLAVAFDPDLGGIGAAPSHLHPCDFVPGYTRFADSVRFSAVIRGTVLAAMTEPGRK